MCYTTVFHFFVVQYVLCSQFFWKEKPGMHASLLTFVFTSRRITVSSSSLLEKVDGTKNWLYSVCKVLAPTWNKVRNPWQSIQTHLAFVLSLVDFLLSPGNEITSSFSLEKEYIYQFSSNEDCWDPSRFSWLIVAVSPLTIRIFISHLISPTFPQ